MAQHDGATRKLNTSTNESGQMTACAAARPSNVDVTSEIPPIPSFLRDYFCPRC